MSPELKIMLRREVQQRNIHISWKPTSEIQHDKSPHSPKTPRIYNGVWTERNDPMLE